MKVDFTMDTTILKRTTGQIAFDMEILQDSLRVLDCIMSEGISDFESSDLAKYNKDHLIERQVFLGGVNCDMVRKLGVLVAELYALKEVTA